MRYGDGGGVDQLERARRELVRQRAAELFEADVPAIEVAQKLEVSTKSAYQWRRVWVAGGAPALASNGASGPDPKLTNEQLARLRVRLEQGPAAAGHGDDQRWTLIRPIHRAAERYEAAVSMAVAKRGVPRLHGEWLLICGTLAVLVGQLTTAAVLRRAPRRRPALRILSYVSLGIVLVLLGYGAVRSIR
jgi:putative transposase